jgi:L-fucose mutarotase/ribose pyranase (RbsD/FucU family)
MSSERSTFPPETGALLDRRLREFGHRNWILVVDAAFPAFSAPGVETAAVNAGVRETLGAVLERIERAAHLRAELHVDEELWALSEDDDSAAAIQRELRRLAVGMAVVSEPHEALLARIATATARYRALVLKTHEAIAYTSVFVHLGCGYWSAEEERALRCRMSRGVRDESPVPVPSETS